MKEVHGGDGEPSARLCPLWWTATGTIDMYEQHGACNTGFLYTLPWKPDRPHLPNWQIAERHLRSVGMKLKQDESLEQAYQSVIDDYKSKGYIREVPEEEPKPSSEWFLPHFLVVCPEKATTKVWIIFDGSAQQNGKSLNSESLPGPELQSDIVDILVKFRKESFDFVGDVTQMYRQLILRPVDRPMHRFLYRNLV